MAFLIAKYSVYLAMRLLREQNLSKQGQRHQFPINHGRWCHACLFTSQLVKFAALLAGLGGGVDGVVWKQKNLGKTG